MNREILFRGKRTVNGEWVEGYYTLYPQGFSGKGMVSEHVIRDTWELIGKMYFVEPETVCQYTGLTDKNGRKIFEGDIVRYIDEVIGKEKVDEVEYNKTHAAFCRLHKSEMGLQYLFIDEAVANKCEVIGNIFDNPELMAKAKCDVCKCQNCFSKSECCPQCEGAISGCEEYSETDIYSSDLVEGGER